MKRLFNKNNPVSRLIALWIVFILALTPLLEHGQLKNGVKAASAVLTCSDIQISVQEQEVQQSDNGDGTYAYYINSAYSDSGSGNADKSNAAEVHYYGDNVTAVEFSTSVASNSAYYTTGGNQYFVAASDFDTLGVVYNSSDDIPIQLVDSAQASAVSAVNEQYYAVYVKVKDPFGYRDDSSVLGTIDGDGNLWTLQKLYKIVKDDTYLTATDLWKNGDTVVDGDVAQSAAISPATKKAEVEAAGGIYLGEIQYTYAGQVGTKTGIGDYSTFLEDHTATRPDTSGLSDGSYVAWVSYSDGVNTYDSDGKVVTIDATAPELSKNQFTTIYQNEAPYAGGTVDTTQVLYLDSASTYTLTINTKEEHPTDKATVKCYKSGTDELVATKYADRTYNTGGYQVYKDTNILTGLDEGITYDLKLVMEDELGNDGGEELLAILCPIDKTFTVNHTITGGTSDNKLKTPTKDKQTIVADISSGNQLGKIEIYDDNNQSNSAIYTEDISTIEQTGGLYKYQFTYTFPANTADVKYSNIKLKVTEQGGAEKIIPLSGSSYVYDVTAPVVENLDPVVSVQKKNDQGVWENLSTDQIVNGQYVLDTTKDETYKFVVKVTENGSGLLSVAAYTDSSKKTYIDSLNPDGSNYSIELTTDDLEGYILANNNKLALYVEAIDNVSLSGNATVSPTIIVPDTKLYIDSALLTADKSGNPVDITTTGAGSYNYNEAYKLNISASSGYPITSITLLQYTEDASTGTQVEVPFITLNIDADANSYNSVTKRYSIDREILIPESVDVDTLNMLLNGVDIKVTDNCVDNTGALAPQTVTESLGDLLYDATKPAIVDKATGTAFATDEAWVKGESTSVEAVISPGPQTVESVINEATYTIENSSKPDVIDSDSNVTLSYVHTDGGEANGAYAKVTIPESKTAAGTKVTFNATDAAGNSLDTNNIVYRRVDNTAPEISSFTINEATDFGTPFGSSIKIVAAAQDNLSIAKIDMKITLEDGTAYDTAKIEYGLSDALNNDSDSISKDLVYTGTLPDGTYKVTVTAFDKAGWEVKQPKTVTFKVDSTAPVVTAKISNGTMGGKKPATNYDGTSCDYYYKSNVTLTFTCSEQNDANIIVTDNGKEVTVDWAPGEGISQGTYTVTDEGMHNVKIEASDATGNAATSKTVSFVKDTAVPQISAMINGALNYTDDMAGRIFTANTSVALTVSDNNEDKNDLNYQIIKAVPGEDTMTTKYLKTTNRTFNFTEEGEYTLNAYARDMANNQSKTKSVSFRVDKNAPNLTISGIGNGGTSSGTVVASFNMQETFWQDATGTVNIYRQSGDGAAESLMETIDYVPTGATTSIGRTFSETGVYRIEFEASDRAGHTSATELTFTIDLDAPVITLSGVKNYDVTNESVEFVALISDDFYASKTVSITGNVTDKEGKVSPISITDFNVAANPTTINQTFTGDGIYDLTISSTDVAGNTESQSVHFTIDKTAPIIGDLSKYDGTTLTSFEWDIDLDELVSDLTVCDIHMYLNGAEYNGEDEIEDGSYVLLITAEDELGQKSEKTVEFVLDTKAPVFIVTGVEDGEVKEEPYQISISLQLEEDILTSVTLNGKVITISNNVANIDITEEGEYTLVMTAKDAAGNETEETIEFKLGQETSPWLWIIIAIAIILILSLIIFFVVKKRKKDKE